jgi:Family of unknown function (DUF5681)
MTKHSHATAGFGDSPASKDYEVGYGRPPKKTRFQPGKSGNPRGRPKAERNFGVALREALDRQIEVVNENGDKRKVAALDWIARGLVADAARRDRAARRDLLKQIHLIDGGKPPDDQQRRNAEFAEAKVTLKAKLDAMAVRYRDTILGEGNSG